MSYLDELLAGYQLGLASIPRQSIQALRTVLAEADNPRQRGALLGQLAKTLAADTLPARPNKDDSDASDSYEAIRQSQAAA
jgi:hypothetical protein